MIEKTYSRFFKAVGDPSRLKILILLSNGEMTVGDITASVGLSQPTVSRHLALLRDSGIVEDRRDGQQVYYRLNKNAVADCCSGFCSCLAVRVPAIKKVKKK